ncbi:SGNH/GDSL hydrolase family protein [Streptomyces brevispora]|uniref:SGNH/GDSL hydrolase family protein n=1 Tax=Streptomyces brevispora TaxID=887462 RepID=UPI002E2FDC08|nr:SGNH/GDSL hydrolase family protein [Streptomyces brevispora]
MPRFRARVAAIAAAAGLCLLSTSTTSANGAAGLEWVALGDSYTAGAIHAAGPTFEEPRDGCQRTTGSYPEVIKRDLGPLVSLRNVSCGNATVADVSHQDQTPIGYGLHIPGVVDINDPDAPFNPVPPQLDAVRPSADLVTVGVGGNSLGFGEILGQCISVGPEGGFGSSPCRDYYTSGTTHSIEERLQRVRNEYDQMLTRIHAKAPFAKIITVGYPAVIPESAASCLYGNILQFATIRHADLNWLRDSVLKPLNTVIEQVSAAHGDKFVDIYTSSREHSVCATGSNKWVEGVKETLGNNEDPNTWALVHPNARGQANAAVHVEDAILGG